jgi:GT2 family glycosyltransferase
MLSIIIPSHNRTDLLRACLASVRRHAPAWTEVLVVDDGSPDEVASQTARGFGGVAVVRLPERRGFCVAANAGLRASRQPIVELLNDDTEVTAGWAEAALARFRQEDDVAAVAPLVLFWEVDSEAPARIDSAGDRYYAGGVAGKRGHGRPLAPAYLRPRAVFGASASSAFYRREAVLRVGGFPEDFGAYFEDVDLAFRLQRAGYRALFEPASSVLHHGSASYRGQKALVEQQSRNEERVFWRNMPGGSMWRAVPLHLAVLAAKAWRRWREGNLLPFLRGRMRVLAEAATIWRHRRRLRRLGPDLPLRSWCVDARWWGDSVERL